MLVGLYPMPFLLPTLIPSLLPLRCSSNGLDCHERCTQKFCSWQICGFHQLHKICKPGQPHQVPNMLSSSSFQVLNRAYHSRGLIKYQNGSYQLYTVAPIKDWLVVQLDKYGSTPDEKLFEMSLAIEPRED